MEQLAPIDAFRLMQAPDPTDAVMAASRLEAKARLRFGVAQALVQGRIGFHYQPVVRADEPADAGLLRDAGAAAAARRPDPAGRRLPAGGRGRPARPRHRPAGAGRRR